MKRNRAATEAKMVEAARALLARSGLQEWGVNHMATCAGVDKVLLYRYFGGLDGLCAQACEGVEVFPSHAPGGDLSTLARSLLDHFRDNPLAAQFLRWSPTVDTDHPMRATTLRQREVYERMLARQIDGPDASALAHRLTTLVIDAVLFETGQPTSAMFASTPRSVTQSGTSPATESHPEYGDPADELPPELL